MATAVIESVTRVIRRAYGNPLDAVAASDEVLVAIPEGVQLAPHKVVNADGTLRLATEAEVAQAFLEPIVADKATLAALLDAVASAGTTAQAVAAVKQWAQEQSRQLKVRQRAGG